MIKLLLSLLLSTIGLAYAEDIYISQTAKGADNGTSAANAHAWTWFNSGINWTALSGTDGRIGPGDTVHLTGVISNQLQIMGSGTPVNRITIKFDPGSAMEHPTWTGTGAIYGTGVHDITIEGKNSSPVKQTLTVA